MHICSAHHTWMGALTSGPQRHPGRRWYLIHGELQAPHPLSKRRHWPNLQSVLFLFFPCDTRQIKLIHKGLPTNSCARHREDTRETRDGKTRDRMSYVISEARMCRVRGVCVCGKGRWYSSRSHLSTLGCTAGGGPVCAHVCVCAFTAGEDQRTRTSFQDLAFGLCH